MEESDIEFQQNNVSNLWNLPANKISILDPFRLVLGKPKSALSPSSLS